MNNKIGKDLLKYVVPEIIDGVIKGTSKGVGVILKKWDTYFDQTNKISKCENKDIKYYLDKSGKK